MSFGGNIYSTPVLDTNLRASEGSQIGKWSQETE
jgi:hypothetical protein